MVFNKNKAKIILAFSSALFLTGCNEYHYINQWDQGFQLHGLNPIYPPKADYQIGDVYLMQGNLQKPLSKDNPPDSLYLAHLVNASTTCSAGTSKTSCNITEKLKEYFDNRVPMPTVQKPEDFDIRYKTGTTDCTRQKNTIKVTRTEKIVTGADGKQSTDLTTITDNTKEDVLGQCASENMFNDISYHFEDALLPTITIKNVNSDVISAIFPINLLKVGLGFGWTSLKDLNIGFGGVKSVRIPPQIITDNIELSNSVKDIQLKSITGMTAESLFKKVNPKNIECYSSNKIINCKSPSALPVTMEKATFSLMIPTEVYYAKTFAVAITHSNGNYFKGGAGLPIPQWNIQKSESTGQPKTKAKTITQTNIITKGEPIGASSVPMGMSDLNVLVRDNVDRALAENMYGGNISSLNMTSKGIGYTGNFNAPIAIAYRGFQYPVEIKRTNGEKNYDKYDTFVYPPVPQITGTIIKPSTTPITE